MGSDIVGQYGKTVGGGVAVVGGLWFGIPMLKTVVGAIWDWAT